MTCSFDQIQNIILNNPNKAIVEFGKKQADVLMKNIYGKGLKESFIRNSYFENQDVFNNRTLNPTSNKDLFARLFQREEMVFTAHGGATFYDGLNPEQTQKLNSKLDSIRFGMNLRSWIQQFALQAYRCDPMSIIFIEIDANNNVYPTYKCSHTIYDYQTIGRQLEYVCFQLTKHEAVSFGIKSSILNGLDDNKLTQYYRFIDDSYDAIYEKKSDSNSTKISIVNIGGKDSIPNVFDKLPAFIVSDIISYNNSQLFISPIDTVIELAEVYCGDRTVRDLQKKYCGFLKSIEPLLDCGTCQGTGFLSGSACPDCTPPGGDHGTGKKLHTNVGDVARFSLEVLKEGFSIDRIFGYVNVPVEVWNKQDMSLNDIENMITSVYWGTDLRSTTTNGPDINAKNIEETATKTLANLQPIYARLNRTANWAQQTENIIIDFIGKHEFDSQFKKSAITYGRYYILETPYSLMDEYQDMKSGGSPQTALTEGLRRYYHSAYKENPIKLSIMLKLMDVEPFIHLTLEEVKAANPTSKDLLCKLYYNNWLVQQKDEYLLMTSVEGLKDSLYKYATTKQKESIDEMSDNTTTLSEKNGVGGTQSLQMIITDFNMSPDQKKWALMYLFGLDETQAINLTTAPGKSKDESIENKDVPSIEGENNKKSEIE